MAVKFSAFTTRTGTLDTSTKIVGYDNTSGLANVQFSLATLQANSGIYAIDGTIGTTRKALITDTIQFRNAGDTSDIFTLNTDGTFTLGEGAAAAGGDTAVAIGKDAEAKGAGSICIGNDTMVDTDAGGGADGIAIGEGTQGRTSGIAIGNTAYCYATNISIGNQAGDYNTTNAGIVTIGNRLRPTGANSISLAARNSSATNIVPNVDNTFNVYLADASTVGAEDFQIVRGGESTLRTSLKITGQAYTPPHVIVDEVTVDWNDSNIQTRTLVSGASNFTPSNAKAGATYILKLTQPSSGTATVSWESSAGVVVNWPGGTAPTLSGTGKIDIVTLICTTGGATSGTFYANATLDFS